MLGDYIKGGMMRVYRLKEAAEHLKVCEDVLMGLIDSGKIKAFDVTPFSKRRSLRIREEELEKYKSNTGIYVP